MEEMDTLLNAEQSDHDCQKVYCSENPDQTEDDATALAKITAGHKDTIQEHQDQLPSTDAMHDRCREKNHC